MTPQPLTKDQFNRMIAFIKREHIDSVQAVRAETFGALKRLGLRNRRDVALSPKGIPEISDRIEMNEYRRWLMGIDHGDTESINQLLAIDAACVWRRS